MGQILQFILPADTAAFDEIATQVMGEAFDAACAEFREPSELARVIIAERIIEAAKRGERDPKRLCSIAVLAVSGEVNIR